jgi:phenylpropionate dioxygenase-like ring-hydroxylating dioxygenase large terminal subunit
MPYDYLSGWQVNPDAPANSLEAKVAYVDNGTTGVTPDRYYDHDTKNLEWQRLWTRTWLIACVESDIPEDGDYSVFKILHEQILIVRQNDQSIRAFYNVCPHRGNRLIENDRGFVAHFSCPFHSWKFGLDGCLRNITDEETFRPEVVQHRPGLTEVRVETHCGLVFINLDPDAPPLEERLGLPNGYLEAYELNKMRVVRHSVSEWQANWKTGIDAFYETYHLHAVHPETQGVMVDIGVQFDLYPHGASRMIVPIGEKSPRIEDQSTVDDGLRYMLSSEGIEPDSYSGDAKGVRPAIAERKRERAKSVGLNYDHFTQGQLTDSWATGIFPNVQIGCHPEGAFLMRFMPHPTDPERFFYDTMTLFRPADDPTHQPPDWMGIPAETDLSGNTRPDTEYTTVGEAPNLGLVLDQDAHLLPIVQQGVKSRGFNGPLWGEQEQRLRHFHVELDRYLSGEK